MHLSRDWTSDVGESARNKLRAVACTNRLRLVTRSIATWLAVIVGILQSRPSTADWPTEGGNNQRTFSTDAPLPLPLELRWSYQAPAAPKLAWSSAEGRVIEDKLMAHRVRFDDAFRTIVVNGRVYFGSTVDHQLHCRDLSSGKELWSYFTEAPIRLSPTVADGRVLFGSDDGRAYCVDAETGAVVWQRSVAPREEWLLARGEMISKWPVRTGLIVHQGVAYLGAGIFPHEDIYLYGVDPATGRQVWLQDNISAQDAGRNDLSPQGYLLASDHFLTVPSGGSLPAVFDLMTNKLLHKRSHSWRTTAGGVVGGTKAILADGQLYTAGEHHLLAMNESTGDVGFGWFEGRQMAIQGDAAYILTGTRLARLNRLDYAVASRKKHALDEKIIAMSREVRKLEGAEADRMRKQIQAAVDEKKPLESIGIVWEVKTSDDRAILAAGNAIIVGGAGRVTAYSPDDGRQLWAYQLEGDARGLAAADGHLLVSTDAGAVLCFGNSISKSPQVLTEIKTDAFLDDEQSELYRVAAAEIIQQSGVNAGYCLIAGAEEARLAIELARQSQMKIYCVEPSAEKVARARRRLVAAGLYGHRVVVHHRETAPLTYSNYFADLITSEKVMLEGVCQTPLKDLERHLKPVGGVICLGRPQSAGAIATAEMRKWSESSTLGEQIETRQTDSWLVMVRGALPGAGNWTHQYGNPANTAVSTDTRVNGDLGVLWYGDPGPEEMVNRHEGAVGPLSVNGRLFVQGEHTIMAYDAYNGRHLWTHENPKALRTGVFQNQNPGNLAAGDDSLFHFVGDKCLQLDMATGKVKATHGLPAQYEAGRYEWGYVAVHQGCLFGTATIRKEIEAALRRRGRATTDATDGLFAIDIATGDHLWTYSGHSISHRTIAIGADRVFFIDSSITSEQRNDILQKDKAGLEKLNAEQQAAAERQLKEADVRLAVALELKTGKMLWEKAVDVTDCSDIGIGGGKLTMMFANDTLILCGANANGHYWKQFVAGEFERRRLVALSAYNGYQMWAKDANYRHRPIIVGKNILAEPWMFDLYTGRQITRQHPITGEDSPWSLMRTGHHCGMLTGCESGMILFRSGHTGFMDLNTDGGIRHFAGHRLGCWINAVAANGLVMIPEASAGCVCQFSIASTIVLEPRESRRPWTIYSAVGAKTPVQRLAINLGAPGDRKDSLGQIWFSYPRRDAYQQTSLDIQLDLRPQFGPGGEFGSCAENRIATSTSETPWIYTSWAQGLNQLTLPLLSEGDDPANYTIRLHFAEPRTQTTVLDVLFNGSRVLTDVSVAASVEDSLQPTMREIRNVLVERDLVIDLQAKSGSAILNAIEVVREPAK